MSSISPSAVWSIGTLGQQLLLMAFLQLIAAENFSLGEKK
jgi:hypothetical protein